MDRHGQEKHQDVEEVEVRLVQPECSLVAVLVLDDSVNGSDLQKREAGQILSLKGPTSEWD